MSDNPFASGEAELDDPFTRRSVSFQKPRSFVVLALYANVVVGVIGTYVSLGFFIDISFLELFGTMAFLELAVFFATVVPWCLWKYRAAKNIRVLRDSRFEFTPGWAIGWYFIPIFNLVRPYQAMKEIFHFSHSDETIAADSRLVGWWWAVWLGGNFLSNITARVEEPATMAVVCGLDSTFTVIAAFVAVALIKSINRAQEDFARRSGK